MNATQTRLMGLLASWDDGLPVLSKLAREMGLASESGVRRALEPLEAAGLVERVPMDVAKLKIPRLTPQGWDWMRREEHILGHNQEGDIAPEPLELRAQETNFLPVFPISCGPWMEANFEPEWTTTGLADARQGDYLCRVKGDSMIDPHTGAGYREGDRIHMRPDVCPENGEVVHAEYPRGDGGNDCTLKVFNLDERSGMVTLWALNPKYPDIVRAAGEVEIKGKALEVVKRVGRYSRK